MKKEEQAKAFAITNYSGTKESDYVMAVSKNSFEAGYTACQYDQQKAWSESCKCSVNDRHGETWCCNHCGLPTAIASQEEDRWIPVSERLPEDFENSLSVQVLTVDSIGRYLATQYYHECNHWMKSDLHAKITHWKPITPPNK